MAEKLGSNKFRSFVLNYGYTKETSSGWLWWKKYHRKHFPNFKNNKNKSRADIYNDLMDGREILRSGTSGSADITLVIDRRNKRSVVGYTYANSPKQWIYSWVLQTNYKRVAGNLAHEWVHKMGYGHGRWYNSTRKHTVPYAVGDYVAEIAR